MSVIRTKTNMVLAYEPEEDDLFVRVAWHGPIEGSRYARAFEGPPWPIRDYQAAVDWAVSMADQMCFPLHVVPLRARDVFVPAEVLRMLPRLTDQERGRLRAVVVSAMAEVMRDSDDRQVRADAYRVLQQMKVVTR